MDPSSRHEALLQAFRQRVLDKIRRDLAEEARRARELGERVVPLVRAAVDSARADGHCQRVWLFGSFAWGRPGERSDIDVLVEGDADEVARRIGDVSRREVHAHAFDRAPASLRERCLSEGVLL